MAAWFRLSHAVARSCSSSTPVCSPSQYSGFVKVPGGFIPSQDQGYLIVVAQLPEGASLSRTDNVVRKITDLARDVEGVTAIVAFAGFDAASGTNAPNKAAVFTRLDSFEERQSLGTAVFSGMLGVTFFGLFLTPVFYVVIRKFTARKKAAFAPPAAEPQVARS
ncbi:MAG: efflux RND transporter permease subunit [Terrimicrobiaceae bacterium]